MKKLSVLILLAAVGCASAPEPAPSISEAETAGPPPASPAPVAKPAPGPRTVPLPSNPLELAVHNTRQRLSIRDFKGAEVSAARALALGGDQPECWTLAAMVAYARRDLPLAEERLAEALRLSSQFRDALVLRGVVRLGMGNYRAAKTDFVRVEALPVAPDRIVDFALARRRHRELVETEGLEIGFDEAVARDLIPVDAPAMYGRWYGELAERLIAAGRGARLKPIQSEHYSLLTDLPEPMANYLVFHLELAHRAYRELLEASGAVTSVGRLRARVFSQPTDYRRFLREILKDTGVPEFAAGSYHPLTRELVLAAGPETDRTLGVLYHEGFHQYLDESVRDAPPWFGEGIADYFGGSTVEGNRLRPGGPNPERILDLERALSGSAAMDLSSVIAMSQGDFLATGARSFARRKDLVRRNYALSWAFVHFLLESDGGARRDILLRYYLALRDGASAAAAAESAFGPDGPADLAGPFAAHARELVQAGKSAAMR